MKKHLRFISFIGVLILMVFFIFQNVNSSNDVAEAASDSSSYTVSVINCTPEAGDVYIAYKNDQGKATYVEGTTYSFNKGTTIKFDFKDGLKDGYEIYAWANYENGALGITTTLNDEGEKVNYTKTYLTISNISQDYTVYVFAKTASSHIVSYYNTYSATQRKLIGLAVVEDGKAANESYIQIPKQSGKDFDYWSEKTNKVTSDMEVYPIYKANVFTVFRDYYAYFLKGLGVTLLLSVISVMLALIVGMGVCFVRLSSSKILNFIAGAYVEIIRGVPLLLQLLIVYIILGPTGIKIGSFFTTEVLSCLIALIINSGAYTSEIFRSGIQAVDKGQMEAGRALGMSKWKVMFKIIMPQGIKNSLPSVGNELIAMIKETSLAVSVDASIGELMSVRKQITASTYINLPPYIIVAIIYFIVTFSLSKLIGLLERRLASHER